jgi:hypothetical protein
VQIIGLFNILISSPNINSKTNQKTRFLTSLEKLEIFNPGLTPVWTQGESSWLLIPACAGKWQENV